MGSSATAIITAPTKITQLEDAPSSSEGYAGRVIRQKNVGRRKYVEARRLS
ncbi:MAG: hypothetical protein AVDCRST_MAG22-93 [uncultured Rubrobacteraceae bacterium]|uniref:Uncharacterized protein n=1 Tax=uncultured Rubrobacteraceae bacterium TaxID=349277 RepID=A0A6J4NBJ9_9ACTN|nr:MAG: hypothetical protein AVDCRST_MAG22-93 [uncultured Rubrobacteraceae bacterium]